MGIAAALEFILALMAAMGPLEFLLLIAGVGLAIGTIWALVACYRG